MKIGIVLAVALMLLPTSTEARPHRGWIDEWHRSDVRYQHQFTDRQFAHRAHRRHAAKATKRKRPRYYSPKRVRSEIAHQVKSGPTLVGYGIEIRRSANLAHVVGPLASKAAEIVDACGSKVISAYRPGARVRGSGRLSLHAQYPARAVDIEGNPACIRRHLAGWPGGQSIDYSRVRHIHISYDPGGREWGAKFAHWQPRKRVRARYAARYRSRG